MRERIWIHNPAGNLLAPENLARIRKRWRQGRSSATGTAHSGMGPNHWMARDFAEFQGEVAQAKPADYYVIWSLPALLEQGVALAATRYDDQLEHGASLLPAAQMQALERYLSDPTREFFGVFFDTDRSPEVWARDDLDGLATVVEYAEWYNKPGPDGFLISAPERPTIERPEYWLLEAQYPNEAGEVLEKHV